MRLTLFAVVLVACPTTPEDPDTGTETGTPPDTVTTPTLACEEPSGVVTHDYFIEADETWSADAFHEIPAGGARIEPGVTVTIEPCAVVRLAPESGLEVDGSLVALGTAAAPIRFERSGGAAWGSLLVDEGYADLAHVTLRGGGEAYFQDNATIVLWSATSGYEPVPSARLVSVTVEDSVGVGIAVDRLGAFEPGSTDVTVTGSGSFPVLLHGAAATDLPEGDYTGNGQDEILVMTRANGGIAVDTTFHDRGLPYRIGDGTFPENLLVDGYWLGTRPLLTLEPGVELRFAPGGSLLVQYDSAAPGPTGALSAIGTADDPIVLTSQSATPQAGDWVGVYIAGTGDGALDPRNAIAFADIGFAGGYSASSGFACRSPSPFEGSSDAAVVLHGVPAGTVVTESAIHDSAGHGVDRGWTGDPIDHLATNTFANVAGCLETYPVPDVGQCPEPPVCP